MRRLGELFFDMNGFWFAKRLVIQTSKKGFYNDFTGMSRKFVWDSCVESVHHSCLGDMLFDTHIVVGLCRPTMSIEAMMISTFPIMLVIADFPSISCRIGSSGIMQ